MFSSFINIVDFLLSSLGGFLLSSTLYGAYWKGGLIEMGA